MNKENLIINEDRKVYSKSLRLATSRPHEFQGFQKVYKSLWSKTLLSTPALMVKSQVCCFLNLEIKLTIIADPDRKFAMFFHVLSISCWIFLSFVLFGAGK